MKEKRKNKKEERERKIKEWKRSSGKVCVYFAALFPSSALRGVVSCVILVFRAMPSQCDLTCV